MDKHKAQQLATALMHKHGVGHVMFEWTRTKRALGHTKFVMDTPVVIGLSTYWVERLGETEVTDTILHEIAHAKAGLSAGHSFHWKKVAREIGAKPDRCAKLDIQPDYLWTGKCPAGHPARGMHRAPGRVKSCPKCSNRFDIKNVIQWYKNGRAVAHADVSAKYAREYNMIVLRNGLV